MEKQFEHIVQLMQRACLNNLSEQERVELQEILKDKALNEVWRRMSEKHFIAGQLESFHRFSAGNAYRQFCIRCHRTRSGMLKRYVRVIAAIVVLSIGITIVWRKGNVQREPEILVRNHLIEPGSRKATLRMADGKMVEIAGEFLKIQEKAGAQIQYTGGEITYASTEKVNELVYNELLVPRAGECCILLEDSTRVWVNADSKLRYPIRFTGVERRVYLEGEAYFEVAKNGKPFMVETSRGDIQVMGTSFNIKNYVNDEKMQATLVCGKICFIGNEKIALEPGEQVVVTQGICSKRKVEVEEYVGWKDGWFLFKNQRLEDIMRDLSRWYDVKVVFQQQNIKEIEFTGNLKKYDRMEVILELLRTTDEVNYKITENTIILYR